jgi:hypothetical protein
MAVARTLSPKTSPQLLETSCKTMLASARSGTHPPSCQHGSRGPSCQCGHHDHDQDAHNAPGVARNARSFPAGATFATRRSA